MGVVGFSVACWGDWVSAESVSPTDPSGSVPSVLFSDGSGAVDVSIVGSDVAGPVVMPSIESEGSVWEDQYSEVALKLRSGVFVVFLSGSRIVQPTNTKLAKQIIRSATSIGANANEAVYGISKADFIAKLQISLKETAETEYWLRLLILSEYITDQEGNSLLEDCLELKKILISTLNTAKENK